MANVDPFVIQWPRQWLQDDSIRPVIIYLNRFLHDLWLRTGGGNDDIEEAQIGELYEPGIQTSDADELVEGLEVSQEMSMILDLTEQIEDLEDQISGSEQTQAEIIATSANFTTTGDQIVICTNTSDITVTLNASPDSPERVSVIRQNTGEVTISGAINGGTSLPILSRYDGIDMAFTTEAGEWNLL